MGLSVDLLDAVTASINASGITDIDATRDLLPEITKENLDGPKVFIALQSKESFEEDRRYISYKQSVGVGMTYPLNSSGDLALGLDMIEEIQDWLLKLDNRKMVTNSGTFSLLPPVMLDVPYDTELAKDAELFYSVLTVTYTITLDRT